MTTYTEYDLERDLRAARRARERARRGYRERSSAFMDWVRSRSTDQWVMFALGFVVGAILF